MRGTMRPLWEPLAHAAGEDSFQSICLALALVRSHLERFEEEGGTLLMDDKPWPSLAFPMGAYESP
jgi:hypothetical protein